MLSSTRAAEYHDEPSLSSSRPPTRSHRTLRSSTKALENAPQASTSRLPVMPPNRPSTSATSLPSCISSTSAFYQVLTAPYRPIALPSVRHINPDAHRRAETYDVSVGQATNVTFEARDRHNHNAAHNSAANMQLHIYKPHGRWAWADGLTIDRTEKLVELPSGKTCSAYIKSGTLGERQITYISRSWNMAEHYRWQGFHSQLALFKSENHLKMLQGDAVPWIIGVHVIPGSISIAMEPPHQAFWFEASPDMPTVLKERCIAAFEKIHARGVLHGDVELRHMLIGGDGKVTIINFESSRSLVPNDDVMLLKAEPYEFALEMRQVKYKLDYNGARAKELEKMTRHSGRKQRLMAQKTYTKEHKDIDEEGTPVDDVAEPPILVQDWNEKWANAASDAAPTRFTMPGLMSTSFTKEVQNLFTVLEQASGNYSPQVDNHRHVRFTSTNVSYDAERPVEPSRKRKPSALSAPYTPPHDTRLSKRPRSAEPKLEEDEPIPAGLPADPILASYMADDSPDKDRFTPPHTGPLHSSVAHIPSPTTNPLTTRFPPIKVRDFAYEQYDGPRGYYAPYPLLESVTSLNRRRWIRQQNEQRCAELGLPQPTGSSSSRSQASKQSIADKRLTRLALGFGSNKRHAIAEGPEKPTRKRRNGDVEREMLEEDFEEDRRRNAKKIKVSAEPDIPARRFSAHIAGPSSSPVVPRRAQPHAQNRGYRQAVGSSATQNVFRNSAASNNRVIRGSGTGEKTAPTPLGALLPPSRMTLSSRDRAQLSDRSLNGQTNPRRKSTPHRSISHHRRPQQLAQHLSEDEVEAILCPSRIDVDSPPLNYLSSWIGVLLRWIQ